MNKLGKAGIFLMLCMGLFFFSTFFAREAWAQEAARTCVTAICHSSLSADKDKVVHNPVKDGTCTACHQAVQDPGKTTKHPDNLTISLVQQGADLCFICHEPKNKKKVVHAPIMGGDCTTCHNPHQSPHKAMLKDVMPTMCFQCHPDSMMKQRVMHSPVAAGNCSICHDNHQSDFPNRLTVDGNALCFTCHPDKEEGVKSKKAVHAPARQSCLLCHNPHGSANKALLISAVPSLCSDCHPSETALSQRALYKHGPMNDPKVCLICHDPHFSDYPRLLPAVQKELCLGCHNKELDTESGKIKDLKTFLEANKGGQGPLKDKPCASCHNPHGSENWRLLVKYYPQNFYTSYSEEQYALCFSCHEKAAFKKRFTQELTNFRKGDKNLHFLHVNKSVKGRTCKACHEACSECQSTGSPKQMKETVQFGIWEMPVNFTLNSRGGSCAPGCHEEKKYQR